MFGRVTEYEFTCARQNTLADLALCFEAEDVITSEDEVKFAHPASGVYGQETECFEVKRDRLIAS